MIRMKADEAYRSSGRNRNHTFAHKTQLLFRIYPTSSEMPQILKYKKA